MHAEDFAKVIFAYISNNINASFNVAPQVNMSINEMARIALDVCECDTFTVSYDSSKPNGQHRKDVNTSLMEKYLPDLEFRSLRDGMRSLFQAEYQSLMDLK